MSLLGSSTLVNMHIILTNIVVSQEMFDVSIRNEKQRGILSLIIDDSTLDHYIW